MNRKNKSICTMLLLSFFTSSTYGAKNLGDNELTEKVSNVTHSYNSDNVSQGKKNHKFLDGFVKYLPSLVPLFGAPAYFGYSYYDNKVKSDKRLKKLKRCEHHVLSFYEEIMGKYVDLDKDFCPAWSRDCDEYLIREMRTTLYLLKSAGYLKINTGSSIQSEKHFEWGLLFPITLLRILNIQKLFLEAYKNNSGEFCLSFDNCQSSCYGKNKDGYIVSDIDLDIGDNYYFKEGLAKQTRENLKIGRSLGSNYYIKSLGEDEISKFYDKIKENIKNAFENNRYIWSLLEQLVFFDFYLKNDGTLYVRSKKCASYNEGKGIELKITPELLEIISK